jgi:septal ring factor EnvC (AmiA/AmiB activator)
LILSQLTFLIGIRNKGAKDMNRKAMIRRIKELKEKRLKLEEELSQRTYADCQSLEYQLEEIEAEIQEIDTYLKETFDREQDEKWLDGLFLHRK